MNGYPLKPTTKPLEEDSIHEIEYFGGVSSILYNGAPSSPKGSSSFDLFSSSIVQLRTYMKSVFSLRIKILLSSVAMR
jgi:hypothetical protein